MDPQARSCLSALLEAYRRCDSYRDRALQTTVFVAGSKPWQRRTKLLEISTAARRPHRLRFAFAELGVGPRTEWPRALLAIDAQAARAWTTHDGAQRFSSAHEALGALAGPSGTAAVLAPALWGGLYADVDDFARRNLGEPRHAGRELVEGRDCDHLCGTTASGHEVELWIERHSGLLARIVRRTRRDPAKTAGALQRRLQELRAAGRPGAELGAHARAAEHFEATATTFDAESSTVFYGAFDAAVPDAELAFDPPV
ncbi:MAG: DUF2092 domain-containing protein [Planctomycetes bacterium]|nr:DUF2092 domain-containing protein [Planctomycetota bacterium]